MKKKFAIALSLVLALGAAPATAYAAGYNDISGHWAAEYINKWSLGAKPILQGYGDGTFHPDDPMRGGDLDIVIERLFGTERAKWDSSAHITREMAAAKIAAAFRIAPKENIAASEQFADHNQIAKEYIGWVYALKDLKLMEGMPGNLFAPKASLTRAEVITIAYDMISELVDVSADAQTAEYGKTVVVRSSGVTLRGKVFGGDLIVGTGVGDGNITLDDCTVKGRLIVLGGGENSVSLINSKVPQILAGKLTGSPTNIKTEGGCEVKNVVVEENGLVKITGKADYVEVGAGGKLTLSGSAAVKKVAVKGEGAAVNVEGLAKAEGIDVQAAKAAINASGKAQISGLTINGANAAVTVKDSAKITGADVNADGAKISGTGTVNKVTVAKGVTDKTIISTPNTDISNKSKHAVVDADGKTVAKAGDSGKTNAKGAAASAASSDKDKSKDKNKDKNRDKDKVVTSVNVSIPTPAVDGKAVGTIGDTKQYTGTIAWSKTDTGEAFSGNFAEGGYTATVTLSSKKGYDFGSGIAVNVSPAVRAANINITKRTASTLTFTVKYTVEADAPVIPVTGISIVRNLTMYYGEGILLMPKFTPENATNQAVIWTSSNPEVVEVSKNGELTTIAAGIATITATSADNSELSATCDVTVDYESLVGDIVKINNGKQDMIDKFGVNAELLEWWPDGADVFGDVSFFIDDQEHFASEYTVYAKGTLNKYVSDKNEVLKDGAYVLAFLVTIPEEALPDVRAAETTVFKASGSGESIGVALEGKDSFFLAYFLVDESSESSESATEGGSTPITLTCDWDGDGSKYAATTYVFDLENLNLGSADTGATAE